MKRKTFDVLVPLTYVVILLIAVMIGNDMGVGVVAVFGAILVGIYYAFLRRGIKTG